MKIFKCLVIIGFVLVFQLSLASDSPQKHQALDYMGRRSANFFIENCNISTTRLEKNRPKDYTNIVKNSGVTAHSTNSISGYLSKKTIIPAIGTLVVYSIWKWLDFYTPKDLEKDLNQLSEQHKANSEKCTEKFKEHYRQRQTFFETKLFEHTQASKSHLEIMGKDIEKASQSVSLITDQIEKQHHDLVGLNHATMETLVNLNNRRGRLVIINKEIEDINGTMSEDIATSKTLNNTYQSMLVEDNSSTKEFIEHHSKRQKDPYISSLRNNENRFKSPSSQEIKQNKNK